MMRFRVVVALLFLSAVPRLVAAVPVDARPAQASPADERLLKLIPDPLPDQAVARGNATFYTADNLFEYMDGAADTFILYDFKKLLHREFSVGKVDLQVDVFDMDTADNAFGIYAAERSPDLNFLAIGAEAYQFENTLNFLQGRYYVKLSAFGEGAAPVLQPFARALSARIGENGTLPSILQQLPRTNLKPHTEQFLLKAPLGHEFLGPAYRATYSLDKQESTFLVSVAANNAEARQRLEQLAQHFRSTGTCEPAPEYGDDVIRASNTFEGKLLAKASGRYLFVLQNPVRGSEAILKEAVDRLK
jgi:hypothetical protein